MVDDPVKQLHSRRDNRASQVCSVSKMRAAVGAFGDGSSIVVNVYRAAIGSFITVNILALQYPDSGKLSTDVLDVDTGIDWLVYPARYSQQCQAQSHFVVRSRLDIVENTEIMVGPNQSFYRGTLRPDCRPFRAGIFNHSFPGHSLRPGSGRL